MKVFASHILEKASDRQVGGTHYKDFAIQPTTYAYRNNLNVFASKVIKYVSRAGKKEGEDFLKDLDKAQHCLDLWREAYNEEQERL